MEDTDFAWPSYKFGFKHSDLTTTLHDKYNTFTSTIQDPEAFHHDVWEISNEAETTDDFHRLMSERRDQRMQELNDTLETLAVEIISNPKLLDSKHWKYALQLFRTRSFDSIVRYFASYLPEDFDSHRAPSSVSSSFSEAHSEHTTHTTTTVPSVDENPFPTFLDEHIDGPVMTEEPCSLDDDHVDLCSSAVGAPLSPPESEPFTDQRSVSDAESHRSTNPPSRSMSFSGSESEVFMTSFIHRTRDHDVDSMSDECDTAAASLTDGAESHTSLDSADHDQPLTPVHDYEDDEYDIPPAQFPEDSFDALDALDSYDTLESDTPTPRQETVATSYMEYKSTASRRLPSPHRRPASPKQIRSDGPYLMVTSRRSPEESASKIQKPSSDANRQRYKSRIRGMV
jgi:hypothetical protein